MFERRMAHGVILPMLTLLLLSGCDNIPRGHTDADIEAMATDAATDATRAKFSEMESQINDLESGVEDLKSEVADLQSELAGARAYSKSLAETADANTDKLNQFMDRYRAHTH
jgi:outer membrane murein-binding lipoprotein Lpp